MSDWNPIPEAPGYFASPDGEVLGRRKQLKTSLNADGYRIVGISIDGRSKTRRVSNLILETFVGPRPAGMVARHLNGCKTDDRLENLAWGTQSENIQDAVRHGTQRNTRKTHCPNGHEYTPENTYITNPHKGWRGCRTCIREKQKMRYAARRGNIK